MLAEVSERTVREGALEPDEDERVRAAVRQIVREVGSQRAAAKRIGVSQQTVSRHLDGFPAGKAVARRVAAALGISYDQLIRGDGAAPRIPVFAGLPGWPEALAAAKRRYPRIPAEAFDGAGRASAAEFPDGAALTPEIVASLARTWEDIQAAPMKSEEEVQAEIDADEPL